MPVYSLSEGFQGLNRGLSSLGDSLQNSYETAYRQAVGGKMASQDYEGAKQLALQHGDIQTANGVDQFRMQQAATNVKVGALQGLGGQTGGAGGDPNDPYGGATTGGGTAGPATGGAPAPQASQGQPANAGSSATDDSMKSDVPAIVQTPTGALNMVAAKTGIRGIESNGSGGYSAVGPLVTYKDGTPDHAYGKYQVMGKNIPQWTQQYLGQSMTPQEFLANPDAQEKVFEKRFSEYAQQYGHAGAANAWFTGSPNPKPAANDGNTTAPDYVNKFMSGYVRAGRSMASAQPSGAPGQASPQPGATPPAGAQPPRIGLNGQPVGPNPTVGDASGATAPQGGQGQPGYFTPGQQATVNAIPNSGPNAGQLPPGGVQVASASPGFAPQGAAQSQGSSQPAPIGGGAATPAQMIQPAPAAPAAPAQANVAPTGQQPNAAAPTAPQAISVPGYKGTFTRAQAEAAAEGDDNTPGTDEWDKAAAAAGGGAGKGQGGADLPPPSPMAVALSKAPDDAASAKRVQYVRDLPDGHPQKIAVLQGEMLKLNRLAGNYALAGLKDVADNLQKRADEYKDLLKTQQDAAALSDEGKRYREYVADATARGTKPGDILSRNDWVNQKSEISVEPITPEQLKQYPGAVGMYNTGKPFYPPASIEKTPQQLYEARLPVAQKLGLQPGTIEFRSYMADGKLPNVTLNNSQLKDVDKSNDALAALDENIATVQTALEQAKAGKMNFGAAGQLQQAWSVMPEWAGGGSESAANTARMDSDIQNTILGNLKTIFGGQVRVSEMNRAMSLKPSVASSQTQFIGMAEDYINHLKNLQAQERFKNAAMADGSYFLRGNAGAGGPMGAGAPVPVPPAGGQRGQPQPVQQQPPQPQPGSAQAAQPPSASNSGISEGATATNPQTGARIIFRNGQWQKLQ